MNALDQWTVSLYCLSVHETRPFFKANLMPEPCVEQLLHYQYVMLIPETEMHIIQYILENTSDRYQGQMQIWGFTLRSVCV